MKEHINIKVAGLLDQYLKGVYTTPMWVKTNGDIMGALGKIGWWKLDADREKVIFELENVNG